MTGAFSYCNINSYIQCEYYQLRAQYLPKSVVHCSLAVCRALTFCMSSTHLPLVHAKPAREL